MIFSTHQRKQAGDTIVEVLIAMAVVSFILAQAYALANHSLRTTQSNQERSESIRLTEQQLERLRNLVQNDSTAIFDPSATSVFCIDSKDSTGPGIANEEYAIRPKSNSADGLY